MAEKVEHDDLEDALKRCGSNWDAAQTHGLLTGRLSSVGVPAAPDWLLQVLDGVDDNNALRGECQQLLDTVYQTTYWQLSERLSDFEPLLPDDVEDVATRTLGLARWCEGFLRGLVSAEHGDGLRERLGAEPLSDIIRDLLQITRAGVDETADEEDNESAYTELVEYVRVAAQLSYEELADFRAGTAKAR